MRKWRIEDSEELYNIKGWGVNYFGINEKGHAYVSPRKDGVQVDLKEVIDDLNSRDITAPVLLRFPDILDNRTQIGLLAIGVDGIVFPRLDMQRTLGRQARVIGSAQHSPRQIELVAVDGRQQGQHIAIGAGHGIVGKAEIEVADLHAAKSPHGAAAIQDRHAQKRHIFPCTATVPTFPFNCKERPCSAARFISVSKAEALRSILDFKAAL